DRVHADIGAAIDRDHAVAVTLAAQLEYFQHQADFIGIVSRVFQKLSPDPVSLVGPGCHLIETIDDQRTLLGGGGDESQLARGVRHDPFSATPYASNKGRESMRPMFFGSLIAVNGRVEIARHAARRTSSVSAR